MSTTARGVVRRFLHELFNERRPQVTTGLIEQAAAHAYLQDWERQALFGGFPDFHLSIEQILAQGDAVTVRATFRATHTGDFLGIPATGKRISGRRTEMFRLDGKAIIECRRRFDLEALRYQLQSDANGSLERADEEPVLAIDEIQGNILPGFQCDYQTLLFLKIRAVGQMKHWLRAVGPRLTTVSDILNHRRKWGLSPPHPCWINIGFTYPGLLQLHPDAKQFTDLAFKEGMCHRAVLLGDPLDKGAAGNPTNWLIGGPDSIPDIILLIASNDRDMLSDELTSMRDDLDDFCDILFEQPGATLQPAAASDVREHFGFRDNISQPGIRGRLSDLPDDFLTMRINAADANQGLPGQNLIWPGEFVFGYAGQNPFDKHRAGPVSMAGPSWTENGSFLVFRRLRQDVVGFRNFLRSAAKTISKEANLPNLSPERLAAKLMGRWPSGAPISRAPETDHSDLARDGCANNHFTYIRPGSSPGRDGFPMAVADLHGLICPHAAHIRRAYPRDASTFEFSEPNIETHRLLRRSIPYGPPFPALGEKGLLFLAYQTAIERQFEFITRAWFNNPNFPYSGAGHDPIVGQNVEGKGERLRIFSLPVKNADESTTRIRIEMPDDWVTPTGGGYFFIPSISALSELSI